MSANGRSLLVLMLGSLAAACGDDAATAIDAGDDAAADDATAIDGAVQLGTWATPLPITSLPFTATGDTRTSTESLARSYDCAAAITEAGAEVVYRLDLAAPTIVDIAVTASTPGSDLDVYVLRAAATEPAARGCVTRDDRAFVADLAAGSWWIAVDTFSAPGAYTLDVTVPVAGACLENPIPSCQTGDAPDVNGAPVAPPGVGGCPAGMARVAGFCIDRWEAALVDWSPYRSPGAAAVVAVSAPGVVPQGYINQTQAGRACVAAGKRLCTDTEWLRACQGAAGTTYPYGASRQPGRCNDARTCHPAVQYFESSDSSVFSMIGHSCLNQLPAGLARTGAHEGCQSADAIYDLMGNLHEWTADPAGTFRGGFYVDTAINGNGCLYRTTAHDVSHSDYSTGFRCCADPS